MSKIITAAPPAPSRKPPPPNFETERALIRMAQGFPDRFVMDMPDDALSLTTPKGEKLLFAVEGDPVPGECVLVRTHSGSFHVRRYAEGPGRAWTAEANTSGFEALHSERDGLALCAVMIGRMSGLVRRGGPSLA